jgi:hypothetical protein
LWLGKPVSANTPYLLSLIYEGGATPTSNRLRFYLNQGSTDNGDLGFSSLPSHGGDIGIGDIDGRTRISDAASGNLLGSGNPFAFSGDIAEIFIYNSALNDANRRQTENYLKTKYGTIDNPLPVQLSFFRAYSYDRKVELQWATQSELNNETFILERSTNNEDFTKIAEIAGQGNSNTYTEYLFNDHNLVNGLQYTYRLSDRDFNGNITQLQMANSLSNSIGSGLVQHDIIATRLHLYPNYPNPFNPSTAIKFEIPGTESEKNSVSLAVFNSLGQRVKQLFVGAMSQGLYELTWDGTNEYGINQPSGAYFLQLKTNLRTKTQRMYWCVREDFEHYYLSFDGFPHNGGKPF